MSSAYGTGSRVIELRQAGGKTTASEKWFSNRMRVHIGTAIRVGSYVFGSSGDFGPSFLTAVEVTTGKIAWQDRAFARAQLLYADGKLVILDEDGTLGIATVTPEGLQVLAKAPDPREPRLDAAHTRGNQALRPRPKEHRQLRAGGTVISLQLRAELKATS